MSGTLLDALGYIVTVDPSKLNVKNTGRGLEEIGDILKDFRDDESTRRSLENAHVLMRLSAEQFRRLKDQNADAIINYEADAIVSVPDNEEPKLEVRAKNQQAETGTSAYGFDEETTPPAESRDFFDKISGNYKFEPPDYLGSAVTVYVLDSGINRAPSEFGDRLLSGISYVNDGLGTEDPHTHGTHVASSCVGNQYGIITDAKVVPIRVLDRGGNGQASNVVAGVYWAIEEHKRKGGNNVPILNISLQGMQIEALRPAIIAASNAGFITTIAAGNANVDTCNRSYFAANLADIPNTLIVGNLMHTGEKSWTSNYGNCVKIWTRGTSVLAAIGEGITGEKSGTSMASPRIAGLIGSLLKNRRPAEVISELLRGATKRNVVKNEPSGQKLAVRQKQVLLRDLKFTTAEFPPAHGFMSPIAFKELSSGEYAGFTFHLENNSRANTPALQLAFTSHPLPYDMFYALDDISYYEKERVSKAKIDISEIKNTGDYWVKYTTDENDRNIVEVGSGRILGQNRLGRYDLGTYGSAMPAFKHIGFGVSRSANWELSQFQEFGNVQRETYAPTSRFIEPPPLAQPSKTPTAVRTTVPTKRPTPLPTAKQTTNAPTERSTARPTLKEATNKPTTQTSTTQQPTPKLTARPTTQRPTTKQTPRPSASTKRPTTQQPTRPTARPSAPTKQATTKRPTTQQPTAKQTARPSVATNRPTTKQSLTARPSVRKSPTAAPTVTKIPLEKDYCQMIFMRQPESDEFKLQIGDKTVSIQVDQIVVRNQDRILNTLPGLKKNVEAITSLNPGSYYLFQLSNEKNRFAINFVPLQRVRVVRQGRTTFEYRPIGTLKEAVSWNNPGSATLSVSLPDTKQEDIQKYDVNECNTEGRRLDTIDNLPNPYTAQSSISRINEFLMSGAIAGASAVSSAITTGSKYLADTNSTQPTDPSTDNTSSTAQIVALGATIAVAAGCYGAYLFKNYMSGAKSSEISDEASNEKVDPESYIDELNKPPIEIWTVPADAAHKLLLGDTDHQPAPPTRKI